MRSRPLRRNQGPSIRRSALVQNARLHQFWASDGRICPTTNTKVDGGTDPVALDVEGHILRRMSLPPPSIRLGRGPLRFDLFAVDRGKPCELVQKRSTGAWELVVTGLDSVR